jgi:hypothetical protein
MAHATVPLDAGEVVELRADGHRIGGEERLPDVRSTEGDIVSAQQSEDWETESEQPRGVERPPTTT